MVSKISDYQFNKTSLAFNNDQPKLMLMITIYR